MKRVQVLAIAASKRIDDRNSKQDYMEGFMAGFREALTMAADLHRMNLGGGGMCDFSANSGEYKFEDAIVKISDEESV